MDIFDVALTLTPRIGATTAAILIEKLFSAKNIFALSIDQLCEKTELNREVAKEIASQSAMDAAAREIEYCKKYNIKIIAATDPEYPPLLRLTQDHPHIIFVQGDINILTHNHIAFVGTRKITPYGQRATATLVNQVAKILHNPVIVSGLAFGVDAEAHRAALDAGIPTIAVIPTTLPSITPTAHSALAREIIASGGAIISEMPSSARNNGRTFIARNRIIAATAATTVIVETPASGGSIHTANIAHAIGRPVCAVPGRITDSASQGCNNLISTEVARAVFSADDIISHAGLNDRRRLLDEVNQSSQTSIELRDELQKIVNLFINDDPYHIDQIAETSGLSAAALTATLMELELLGAVRMIGGSRYERIIPRS